MQTPAQKFWDIRLQSCKEALEKNNFDAFIAPNTADAARIVCDQILPQIVSDLDQGIERIKNLATPANAIRHEQKTPCVKTAYCMDCSSPARICNVWTIHEKSYPEGRIKVILINQDLGL